MSRIWREYFKVDNQPRGLVVAQRDGDMMRVGYSLCGPNDNFSYKVARDVAEGRMNHGDVAVNGSHGRSYRVSLEFMAEDTGMHLIDEPIPGQLHNTLVAAIAGANRVYREETAGNCVSVSSNS